MKIIICISLILVLLNSCNEQPHPQNIAVRNYFDSIEQQNIRFLDSLRLSQFNDSAKWILYTIHYNDSSKYGKTRNRIVLDKIPLVFLRISLTYIEKKGDTLSLLYKFVYNDSTVVEQTTAQRPITDGVEFDTKNQKIIGYIKGEAIILEKESGGIYKYPLQAEVINFMKNNRDRLNPWFSQEARRRKIIN